MSILLDLVKYFIQICLNIFFRDIKVRGFHHIPKEGPVLFAVAPHANQFVDPLMLTITCGRNVGFLAAKKSMDKFWIGAFARILNSIPVERPQDLAKPGAGTVYIDNQNPLILRGIKTKFTDYSPKSTISLPKGAGEAVVAEVKSDTELLLLKPFESDSATTMLSSVGSSGEPAGTKFKHIPLVDQSKMFEAVVKRLSRNAAVGIFPEGGSHDRSEMLPLKAGVAIMALETLSKFPGTKLKIIPTGLHYFNADKFRSRAVVEYGEAIEIPIELVDQFKKGGSFKRQAISLLLDTIHIRIKALTLQAPDFESLIVAQATRRLYQPEKLDADSALIISRRFAAAYAKLKDVPKVKELTQEVLKYNRMLKFYGVQDHQVKNTHISVKKAIFLTVMRYMEVLFLLVITAPVMILFSPLFVVTQSVSKEKAKGKTILILEAKAGSTVKISGKDVVATWKLLTALIVTPLLWIFYTFVTYSTTYYYYGYPKALQAAIFFFVALPIVGISSIRLSDLAFDVSKSIRPLIVSIGNVMSSSEPLREMRAELQTKIRLMVEEMGPEIFEDFEEIRVVKKEDFNDENGEFDEIAKKLNRSRRLATPALTRIDSMSQINALFSAEIDKVKLDF